MGETSYISKDLHLDCIVVNPDNELIYDMDNIDELASTIDEDGFTDPVGVYDLKNGQYELFSGHRRYLAQRKRQAEYIPSLIYEKPTSKSERARRLIRSNSKNRLDTPIQKAKELKYYYENVILEENKPGNKRLQLAQEFNMSEGSVAKYLALLDLIPELQKLANSPDFSYSSFFKAASLDMEKQKKVYNTIMSYTDADGHVSVTRPEIVRIIERVKMSDTDSPIIDDTRLVTITPASNLSISFPASGQEVTPTYSSSRNNSYTSNALNDSEINYETVKTPVSHNQEPSAPVVKKVFTIDSALDSYIKNLKVLTSQDFIVEDQERVKAIIADLKNVIRKIETSI